MQEKKYPSVRALVVITTEKLAKIAADLFKAEKHSILYSLLAEGTASSEILDMLGLGITEKRLLISILSKKDADLMLKKLHLELSMNTVNSGIAFTVPLTSANNLLLRMITAHTTIQCDDKEGSGKEEEKMVGNEFALIAAVVNRGFSGDVMVSARAAGAVGGTVIHSRQIMNEEMESFWGINMQEEKEVLLIISEVENKTNIMKAISEQYGMHSEAKGVVISMPIDSVMGI